MIRSYKSVYGIRRACITALKNKLYVPGWTLEEVYTEPHRIKYISFFYNGKIPVGVFAHYNVEWHYCNIGTFVKEEYRRTGIGTKLLTGALMHINVSDIEWAKGEMGSEHFYQKLLIS